MDGRSLSAVAHLALARSQSTGADILGILMKKQPMAAFFTVIGKSYDEKRGAYEIYQKKQ